MFALICKYYGYRLTDVRDLSPRQFHLLIKGIAKIEKLMGGDGKDEKPATGKAGAYLASKMPAIPRKR